MDKILCAYHKEQYTAIITTIIRVKGKSTGNQGEENDQSSSL